MKKLQILFLFILLSVVSLAQYPQHQLSIKFNIADNFIEVEDEIQFPKNYFSTKNNIQFSLNSNLIIEDSGENYKIEQTTEAEKNKTEKQPVTLKNYTLTASTLNQSKFILKYKGIINDEIKTGAAEYARGFSETTGIISETGIYLAGATYWVPKITNIKLVTFTMQISIDSAWNIVSQGERTENRVSNNLRNITYNSPNPVDEIYLIGAKWTEYSITSGKVLVQAFLRTPDEKLANKYLQATKGYLQMYETLIGPYPYKKFALVENFWETGYGMPSFTLLGEKIIRFPWILYSSYPHELLHNYWGNSVFVDYKSGNWCEGITAYMADHLLKEQRGQGDEYRRATLQKFTDFVNPENDFPVVDFRTRHNSAEEAIGYGKVLMINNMLRDELGDSIFIEAYRDFYNENKFKIVDFNAIKNSFEKISGKNLDSFFTQWLNRKGAPSLELTNVKSIQNSNEYNLSFTLKQIQEEDVFELNIPIAIILENNNSVIWERVNLNEREKNYSFIFNEKPLKIEVDPQFNLFRRLNRKETPTGLSQVFGGTKNTIILPSSSSYLDDYEQMATIWKQTQEAQGNTSIIVKDNDLDKLPTDNPVWVLGKDNKFASQVIIPTSTLSFLSTKIQETLKVLTDSGSLIYVIANPLNEEQSIGFISSDNKAAIKGLTRKLPHYTKYGYLGFKGENPDNVLKGTFPILNSPLNYIIKYEGITPEIKARLTPRKALVQLK
ncbi:MAG: M1 family metallopeptidase [Chlorobi bacterium]|nr:M1 family metallopeptidase [Chlorobiota bacterium]